MSTFWGTDHKGKNFFIIAFVAVLIAVGIISYRSYYNRGVTEPPEVSNTLTPREPTEAEKLLKSQNEELDKLRAQYQAQGAPHATATPQNQVKSLDAIRAEQKTTSTAPKKTLEQQIQELDALRATANK